MWVPGAEQQAELRTAHKVRRNWWRFEGQRSGMSRIGSGDGCYCSRDTPPVQAESALSASAHHCFSGHPDHLFSRFSTS